MGDFTRRASRRRKDAEMPPWLHDAVGAALAHRASKDLDLGQEPGSDALDLVAPLRIPKGMAPPEVVIFRSGDFVHGLRTFDALSEAEAEWQPAEVFLYDLQEDVLVMGCVSLAPPSVTGFSRAFVYTAYLMERVSQGSGKWAWREVPKENVDWGAIGEARVVDSATQDTRVWDTVVTATTICWKLAVWLMLEAGEISPEDVEEPLPEVIETMEHELGERPPPARWVSGIGGGKTRKKWTN